MWWGCLECGVVGLYGLMTSTVSNSSRAQGGMWVRGFGAFQEFTTWHEGAPERILVTERLTTEVGPWNCPQVLETALLSSGQWWCEKHCLHGMIIPQVRGFPLSGFSFLIFKVSAYCHLSPVSKCIIQGWYLSFTRWSFPSGKIIPLSRLASESSFHGSGFLKVLYEVWCLFKWICFFAVLVPCWLDSCPWGLLSISVKFHSSFTESLICVVLTSWGFLFLCQWTWKLMYISCILLGGGLGQELERHFPFPKGCTITRLFNVTLKKGTPKWNEWATKNLLRHVKSGRVVWVQVNSNYNQLLSTSAVPGPVLSCLGEKKKHETWFCTQFTIEETKMSIQMSKDKSM